MRREIKFSRASFLKRAPTRKTDKALREERSRMAYIWSSMEAMKTKRRSLMQVTIITDIKMITEVQARTRESGITNSH